MKRLALLLSLLALVTIAACVANSPAQPGPESPWLGFVSGGNGSFGGSGGTLSQSTPTPETDDLAQCRPGVVLGQEIAACLPPNGDGVPRSLCKDGQVSCKAGGGACSSHKGVACTLAEATPTPTPDPCCKHCVNGKACGDTCIANGDTCTASPGCACNG